MGNQLKDKEFVITIETGLWDNDKYLKRIEKEKKHAYKWPGELPSDKKQYLPWKTRGDESLARLKPGTEIKVHEVLYDASMCSRPGRFQCLDVTATVNGQKKRGFVWTIYEGTTHMTPKTINKDNDYTFTILKPDPKQNWISIELEHDFDLPESWDDTCVLFTTKDKGEKYKQEVSFLDATRAEIDGKKVTITFTDLIPNKKYSCNINLGNNAPEFSKGFIQCFNDFKISKDMINKS